MAKLQMKIFPKGKSRPQNHFEFYSENSSIHGTYLKREMEKFAINILKALNSKHLKK